MHKPITDRQFDVLFQRGYSKAVLARMDVSEAAHIIGQIAIQEGWPSARREHKAPEKRRGKNHDSRHRKVEPGQTCVRCGAARPKAYPVPGTRERATLCRECRNIVMAAALMEYTPGYQADCTDVEKPVE